MTNVMSKAWEIARKAANRFGGKAKAYFQQALIQAWAEYKGGNDVKAYNRIKLQQQAIELVKLEIGEHQEESYRKYGDQPSYARVVIGEHKSSWLNIEDARTRLKGVREYFVNGECDFNQVIALNITY